MLFRSHNILLSKFETVRKGKTDLDGVLSVIADANGTMTQPGLKASGKLTKVTYKGQGIGEAAVEAESCEGALNNPRETGNLERPLCGLDDLQVPPAARQLPSKLATCVSRISNDGSNGRPERREPGQQSAASSSVRHVGWFNAIGDRKAEDINQNVAFSSLHSLVPIEATNAALFSCFHRLAVHDDDCRIWLSTRCQASQRIECTVQQRPNTRHTPASDAAVYGRPGREVVGS